MGNIATKLSEIAKANCAVTYSFGNGRDFGQNIVPTIGSGSLVQGNSKMVI